MDTRCNDITTRNKNEALCNACLIPIKENMRFYKCTYECNFVLHEWCTRLTTELKDYKIERDQLRHFSHRHPLTLVYLQQPNHNADDEDEEEKEKEKEEDFVEEDHHGGQCEMCNKEIWSFHLCYYYCKSCNYSLHKFCAELPMTQQNHPSHPSHILTLSNLVQSRNNFYFRSTDGTWKCSLCNLMWKNIYNYHCSICNFNMDIICATMSEQKINHPSHPHRLERMSGPIVSGCLACGNKHEGEFFQCTNCPTFRINLDCALLPTKLLIQNHTNGTYTHSHPLTLAYSYPHSEIISKYYPFCRVCDGKFYSHLWIYKCDKCRYYVHVDCATSKREPFMSIFLHESLGKTFKNYKEDEHPNLLHCPFPDEDDNLLKHHMSNQMEFISKQHDGEMLNHPSHQHPLIFFNEQTSVDKKMVSLHDPMKRIQLLCDGCVKPITTVPFYMCCQYVDEQCCFVLHEWCAKLPSQVQDYAGHPEHPLSLLPKIPGKFFGVFKCSICELQSNGFVYGCITCEFYVDINCAFIPKEITHDAHPDHLLLRVKPSTNLSKRYCKACQYSVRYSELVFHCPSCDFYIHVQCALLLPKLIKHKCDKHPLSLRYEPVENHISQYFCEICEDEFDPWEWFYHCTTCAQSMHAACGPLILQCEQATYAYDQQSVYRFLNVKFGGTLEIKGHSHRLAFVQGLERDGKCSECDTKLQYEMIFKCLECEFALDYKCASSFVS
ncbi:hypothetical protein L1987_14436 [Smallanthus sonchifolius]|uniref:Uncharacterized protein n=1 Tax=Smallanthus sonchifolius TaxID=185202 RepID=A0ACB9J386_9ASTR|nr:hypothetical protein L1987_14436 [Smallanthus sonchifolius]